MTTRTRVLLAVLIGALALGACTSPTPTLSVTASTSVSSASPTPTPDLSGTRKDAADTVVKYRALIDELRQQYKPDVSRLLTLAQASAYEKWRYTLQDDFKNGYRQVGTTSVRITATASGPTAADWTVTACVDYSNASVVDKDGKTIDGGDAKGSVSFIVRQKDQTWFVIEESDAGTC